jgi:hypothetical protein
VVTNIKIRRLEWAGPSCRMGGSRTLRKILDGKIFGRIPVGKPKDRWINTVTNDGRKLLETTGSKKIGLGMKN